MDHPQELALAQLVESKLNPRKTFIEAEITEIAESAAALVGNPPQPRGILEPLIVRPRRGKSDLYEIVAGAKRFRAAQRASLATVPVRMMYMTDQEVLEAMLIENLQRSDPHPLEEADGYQRLLAMDTTYSADSIAVKVGKDRSYVYKRLQLVHLIEPLKGKFLEGKINIGHALQLCRLQEADQILVAKQGLFYGYGADREAVSLDRLHEFIERNIYLKLTAAPWRLDDAELLPKAGACIACTKRTGANLALFNDTGKEDRCLDRHCFEEKQAALVQVTIAKSGEKGVDLVRVAKGWQERQKKQASGVLGPDQYHEAIKSKCAKPEPAIIVAGEEVGRKFQLCRQRGCKHHGGYRAPARSQADVWKGKERELDREIDDQVNQRVASIIMTKADKLGDHETRAIARDGLEHVGEDDLKFLAGACGFDVAEAAKKKRTWKDNPLLKAMLAHVATAPPKTIARLITGTLALTIVHDKERRDDFEHAYKIDRKKLTQTIGAEARAAFKKQKAAALAKVKKPKKPAPAAKRKAAAK